MIYRGRSLRPPQMVWLKQTAQAAVSWEQALIGTASRLRDPELVAILIRWASTTGSLEGHPQPDARRIAAAVRIPAHA